MNKTLVIHLSVMLMGLFVMMTDFIACRMLEYCKFGNLRESFIFMKLCGCKGYEVS